MNKQTTGIMLGLFVAGIMVGSSMSSTEESDSTGHNDGYRIKARFENVGGVKVLSPVRASGVKVGEVIAIEYDNKEYIAEVSMMIEPQYHFPVDTSASILTVGFSGEQYIAFTPGAERRILKQGDVIDLTEPALILEQVISQFIYSKAQN